MSICAKCVTRGCLTKDETKMPKMLCPSRNKQILEKSKDMHVGEDLMIAVQSALVEAEGNTNWTRIQETIAFAQKCNYKKIGVAFCTGLHEEAKVFVKILEHHGLEVVSIVCKNGAILKGFLGIPQEEKEVYIKNDIMCNPIGQALALNELNTDLNILFGLCVGHDTLFIKHSESPVTVFAVKDRVLCHNPVAAIYQADAYYKKKLFK
ncbi:MAG: DUF1847 domain-containing protein [Cetobacterium sp.]|uniref:DUF1847 domain-containing protein n=1 Tax=Cetobacterium sp. TaxID=2071632 RepID=UPI003F3EDFA5